MSCNLLIYSHPILPPPPVHMYSISIQNQFSKRSWGLAWLESFNVKVSFVLVRDVRTVLFWVILVKDQTELVKNPYS